MQNTMILFARHGETENGKEKKFEGVLDSPLTDLGKEQAEKLTEICLQKKVKKIYSSPMVRARQTAEFISQRLNIPITIRNELREICYGEFEGRTRNELEKLPIWKIREKNFFNFVHPGECLGIPGQSYANLYKKLNPFFRSLKKETQPVVVVAHAGVIRCAKKFFEGGSDIELRNFRVQNGNIYLAIKTKDINRKN